MGNEEMHLGWTGGKLCLGAGPIRLRFTPHEMSDLIATAAAKMAEGETPGSACGCMADTVPLGEAAGLTDEEDAQLRASDRFRFN